MTATDPAVVASASYWSAVIHLAQGNMGEAQALLERVASSADSRLASGATLMLGSLMWSLEEYEEAAALFTRAGSSEDPPEFVLLAYLGLGSVLKDQNRQEEAKSAFQSALSISRSTNKDRMDVLQAFGTETLEELSALASQQLAELSAE